jgi:prepilin-type N-terminal cleavage/methylation domain-containing protein
LKKINLNRQDGFTLFELAVTLTIFGVVALITYGIIGMNARTFEQVTTNTVGRWDIRKAMGILKQEVQRVNPDNLHSSSFGGGGHRLRFTDENGDDINIFRNNWGNVQIRRGSGAWQTLVQNIQQNPFTYRDINLATTTVAANVVYIDVNLVQVVNGRTIQLQERLYVRN